MPYPLKLASILGPLKRGLVTPNGRLLASHAYGVRPRHRVRDTVECLYSTAPVCHYPLLALRSL